MQKNAKYVAVELDMDPEGKAIRAEMGELLGRTSVPAVWIDGKFVGGCNDGPMGGLVKLDEAGDLDGMLKAAGSI
jgi:glutaredoxin 3